MPVRLGIGETLSDLGLPEEVARRWSRFASPLEVNLFAARSRGQVSGAAIVVSRHLSASVKIGGLWSRPGEDSPAVEAALLSAAEELARQKGAIIVKRELDDTGTGHTATCGMDDGAYVPVPTPAMAGPAPAGRPAVPAGGSAGRRPGRSRSFPIFVRRPTSRAGGGPAHGAQLLRLHPAPDRSTEIGLWREATTVGGCDPYGMAVVAARHGLDAELTVTTDVVDNLQLRPDPIRHELTMS